MIDRNIRYAMAGSALFFGLATGCSDQKATNQKVQPSDGIPSPTMVTNVNSLFPSSETTPTPKEYSPGFFALISKFERLFKEGELTQNQKLIALKDRLTPQQIEQNKNMSIYFAPDWTLLEEKYALSINELKNLQPIERTAVLEVRREAIKRELEKQYSFLNEYHSSSMRVHFDARTTFIKEREYEQILSISAIEQSPQFIAARFLLDKGYSVEILWADNVEGSDINALPGNDANRYSPLIRTGEPLGNSKEMYYTTEAYKRIKIQADAIRSVYKLLNSQKVSFRLQNEMNLKQFPADEYYLGYYLLQDEMMYGEYPINLLPASLATDVPFETHIKAWIQTQQNIKTFLIKAGLIREVYGRDDIFVNHYVKDIEQFKAFFYELTKTIWAISKDEQHPVYFGGFMEMNMLPRDGRGNSYYEKREDRLASLPEAMRIVRSLSKDLQISIYTSDINAPDIKAHNPTDMIRALQDVQYTPDNIILVGPGEGKRMKEMYVKAVNSDSF